MIIDNLRIAKKLGSRLRKMDPAVNIIGCANCLDDAVQWQRTKPQPEILVIDKEIYHGPGHTAFVEATQSILVVFTGNSGNFSMSPSVHFVIDYLPKPITAESVSGMVSKYRSLKNFTSSFGREAGNKHSNILPGFRERFLAKVGARTFVIQTSDIAYFFADNKIVYLVDASGNKYVVAYTMEKLEPILDPHYFFRANRSVIVHSKMIDMVKPFFNNRLKLTIKKIKTDPDIIISRERVPAFRKWIEA